MALPKVATPKYNCELPLSGTKVSFRPFLAKEEKILLMAGESGDPKAIVGAVADIVSSCTDGAIDANDLTSIDLEYFFLQLRKRSISEVANFRMNCKNESCEHKLEIEVNFDDVEVEGLEEYKKMGNKKIELGGNVGFALKFPDTASVAELTENDSLTPTEKVFKMVTMCIDYIYDAEQVYKTSESTPEELAEFIGELPMSAFSEIQEFFDMMPKLVYKQEFTCPECQTVNRVELEGMQDFFQ